MYFTKIRRTQAQLELMMRVLTLEYGAKDDDELARLISKYFEASLQDVKDSLQAYRAMINEDLEQQSKRVEYAGI